MRHLTTEELLLHCDGTLAPELVAHVQECPACTDSWLQVQAVLFEAEQALRASVPDESVDHRSASRRKLERALYPPKSSAGFPLRWSVVYGMAAALTFTVLGGYLSTRQQVPQVPQLAAVQTPVVEPESPAGPDWRAAGVGALESGPPAALMAGQPAPDSDALTADSAQPAPAWDAGQVAADPQPSEAEAELARFELSAPDDPRLAPQRAAWMDPPRVTTLPASMPVAALISPPAVPTFRAVVEEAASAGPAAARVSDPAAFARVIEGYWLLTQAKVWEEDLQPAWTSRGLVIEGTVEDEAVRQHVEAALLRQTSQPPALRLRLRAELPVARQPVNRRSRVVHAVYSGPAGGAARRSLLSHFSDAARQSFVAPQASALDTEVVRYVSEVYGSQSELLSHAYALERFLGRVDAAHLTDADPQTTRRFRELVRFHLRSLDEREAAIYDHLSEALPRKIWSHRGAGDQSGETPNWSEESQGLLQDTLELDSNLTALFGSSSLTTDASDPELSCGELLHRIRTRIQRIKNRTQAL